MRNAEAAVSPHSAALQGLPGGSPLYDNHTVLPYDICAPCTDDTLLHLQFVLKWHVKFAAAIRAILGVDSVVSSS